MSAGRTGPDDLPRLGSRVGRYRLDALLGRGGMGIVFQALDLELQRAVAIKFLSPELAGDVAFRERFVRESRLAAAIEHPAIVPIYEAGTIGDSLFIAMRFISGRDLGQVLRSEAPLDLARTLMLLGPVADALDAAHRRGLVHRDVKPANILVEREDAERAYLTDFGLSRRMGERTVASRSGPLGTIDYLAPEQAAGGHVDGRADQYALACLLMHGLSGTPPFEGDSEAAVIYAQVHSPPPRLHARRPDLPTALDAPLIRALGKEPAERFPDCRSLMDALEAAAEPGAAVAGGRPPVPGGAALATPPGARAPSERAVGRHAGRPRRALSLVVVALMVLALVGVGATFLWAPSTDVMPPGSPTPSPLSSPRTQRAADLELHAGEVLVFAAERDGDYDLYSLTAESARPVRILDTPQDEHSPAISPDGTTIAYTVGAEPVRDVWLVGIDGKRPRRLTFQAGDDSAPAWSRDGRWLAFESGRAGSRDIWRVRAGQPESTAQNLTNRFPAVEQQPDWLPGDDELVIASNYLGGNRDIFRIEAASQAQERLTATFDFDFNPSVSPDGRSIAFYRTMYCAECPALRGARDVMVMDATGRVERNLTRTPGRDELDPDWAPDGRALVYSAPGGLIVESIDSGVTRWLVGWSSAAEPSWGVLPRAPRRASPGPTEATAVEEAASGH